jgi:3-methyladenine DNA glycosylase AlkD
MQLAQLLLNDSEDLIHKVCGWMLREVAKRDQDRVTEFLRANFQAVPRTMLRYAIERYPKAQRQRILRGQF